MNSFEITLTAGLCLVLLFHLSRLVRRNRLDVGYGLLLSLPLLLVMVVISVQGTATLLGEDFLPIMGGTLVIFGCAGAFVLLTYAFVQLSVQSKRLARLVQALALREATDANSQPSESPLPDTQSRHMFSALENEPGEIIHEQ